MASFLVLLPSPSRRSSEQVLFQMSSYPSLITDREKLPDHRLMNVVVSCLDLLPWRSLARTVAAARYVTLERKGLHNLDGLRLTSSCLSLSVLSPNCNLELARTLELKLRTRTSEFRFNFLEFFSGKSGGRIKKSR